MSRLMEELVRNSRPGTAGKRRPRNFYPFQPPPAVPRTARAEDGAGAAAARERPRSEEPRPGGQSLDLTAKCERQSKELRELRRRCKELEGLLVAEQQRTREAPPKVRVAQVAVQTEDDGWAKMQAVQSDGQLLVLEDIEEQRLQLDAMHLEASARSREVRGAQETIRMLRKEAQQHSLLTDQYREQVEVLEAEKTANDKRSATHNDESGAPPSRPVSALSRPGSARIAESSAASRTVSARSGVPPRPTATPARAPTAAWSSGDGSRPSSPAPSATPVAVAASPSRRSPREKAPALPHEQVPAWSNPGRIRRRRSDPPAIDGDHVASPSPATSPSLGHVNSSAMVHTPKSRVEVRTFPRSPSPAARAPTGTPFGTPMNRPVLESSSDEDDDEDEHFRRERRAWTER